MKTLKKGNSSKFKHGLLYVTEFKNGYAKALRKQEGLGNFYNIIVIDTNYNEILNTQYTHLAPMKESKWLPKMVNEKRIEWINGYISARIVGGDHEYCIFDKNLEKVENHQYDYIAPINNKYFEVRLNGKFGLLDGNLNVVIPIEATTLKYFQSDMVAAIYLKDNFTVLYNIKNGTHAKANSQIFDQKSNPIDGRYYYTFTNKNKKNSGYGLYDDSLKEIVPAGDYVFGNFDNKGNLPFLENCKSGLLNIENGNKIYVV